jgi:hypothetical protein
MSSDAQALGKPSVASLPPGPTMAVYGLQYAPVAKP